MRGDSNCIAALECDLKPHNKHDVGGVQFVPAEVGAVSPSNISVLNLVISRAGVSRVYTVEHSNAHQLELCVGHKFSLLPRSGFIQNVYRGLVDLLNIVYDVH